MSIKRLAVIAAVSAYTNNSNTSVPCYSVVSSGGGGGGGGNDSAFGIRQGHQSMRSGATLHGNVNILLGGAMLSVVITIVCIVCYCCHRNIKKRTNLYRQRWLENDPNIEVYSVEQCYETSGLFTDATDGLHPSQHVPAANQNEPPPSYDVVLAMDEVIQRPFRYSTNETNQFTNSSTKYLPNYEVNSSNNSFRTQLQESVIGAASLGLGRSIKYTAAPNRALYYKGCPLCGKFEYASPTRSADYENLINANVECDTEGQDCDCSPTNCTTTTMTTTTMAPRTTTNLNTEFMPTSEEVLDANSNCTEDLLNNNNNYENITPEQLLAPVHNSDLENNPRRSYLESIDENGIVRLDMSRIMDKTGLPTYEAALKLESSGYV